MKLVFSMSSHHPITSLGWCGVEGELVLAAVSTLPELLFAKCVNDSWTVRTEANILPQKSEAPCFLAWSPPSPGDAYLFIGQREFVATLKFVPGSPRDPFRVEKVKSSRFPEQQIHDVTWEQCLGSEIRRPMVLLEHTVMAFSDCTKLDNPVPLEILSRAKDSLTLKFGWSDNGTTLNVYCIE